MRSTSLLEKILKYSLGSAISLSGCGFFVPGTTLPDGGDTLYELACYETQPEDDLDCDNIPNSSDPCPFDYNNDCDDTIPGGGLFSPGDGDNSVCYYMSDSDYNAAVSLFTEIAQYYPKGLWLEANDYPCDAFPDLQSDVPRSDCVQCTEHIFDEAGWGNSSGDFENKISEGDYSGTLNCTKTINAPAVNFFEETQETDGPTFNIDSQGLPDDRIEGQELDCTDLAPGCQGKVIEIDTFIENGNYGLFLHDQYTANNLTTNKEFNGEVYHSDNSDFEFNFYYTAIQSPTNKNSLSMEKILETVVDYNSVLGTWTTTRECNGTLYRE